jgi:hypothetical protein
LNDPTSNAYKVIFREACKDHDACYHAPWDRISDYSAGFNKCNDNFWNDMRYICAHSTEVGCAVVATAWATAMNADPGRAKFFESFAKDQIWKDSNCQR